jgi:hypothetical protein
MTIGDTYRRFGGAVQYGPTFPRGGNAAVFAVEVFAADAGAALTVIVEHKNASDTSWTTLATLAGLTAGVNTQTATGIKEQLRLSFAVTGTNAWDSVYANVLAPSWRPY